MTPNKQLYILAGFDAATQQKLSGWEALLEAEGYHGQQTRGIPAHITLGMFPPDQEARVKSLVTAAAKETAAFPITFNHLGIFGGSRVLFAAPDVTHDLLNLKERFGPAIHWTAHATLLIDEPHRVLAAVKSAIQAFAPFEGRIEHLYLYEFFPARLVLSLPLAGKKIPR